MAVGAHSLRQATRLVEPVDRRNQLHTVVIAQQRPVHQPHRTPAALAPTLGSADHLAAVEVDVVAAVAEGAVDFAHRRIATQFGEQVANGLAQPQVTGFDAVLVTFATRRCIHQRDIHRGCRLWHRLTAGFTQQHRPTLFRRHLAGVLETGKPAQAPWHHQRLVTGLPEQQAKGLLARTNGGEQILFGRKACFYCQGNRLHRC
ncbi:MAG: hypothetical protein GAK37_03597 [Pseudomonas sp.]|nr:MAG: hypothetical protein GAK37_03597 [Pseudomonas sp.]